MKTRETILNNNILPNRIDTHIQESESYKIFAQYMPKTWVIRSMTERDYGIDLFIEIASDNKMTGRLFTCQLKSINEINNNLTCYNIESSSFNYWYLLPTQTFVFFVDIKNKEVYFCNIKEYIREYYSDFEHDKLNKIKFDSKSALSALSEQDIEKLLIEIYDYENSLKYMESLMMSFVLNFEKNLNLLSSHIGLDGFLALGDMGYDDYEYIVIYKLFHNLCSFFNIEWNIPSLQHFYKIGQLHNKEYLGNTIFFEEQANDLSILLIPIMGKILDFVEKYIDKFNSYWNNEYLDISLLVNNKFEQLKDLYGRVYDEINWNNIFEQEYKI